MSVGDIQDGFKQSDQGITGEYSTGYQEHFYLEPWSCLVVPRGDKGEMDISVGTQNLNTVQVLYYPRKLCLWEGILFSRCPSVHSSERMNERKCVRNFLFP